MTQDSQPAPNHQEYANRADYPAQQQPPLPDKTKGVRLNWQTIVGLVLLLPIILFAFINAQKVSISLLFVEFQIPLILIILFSMALGSICTLLISWNLRRKRAKKLRDQDISAT